MELARQKIKRARLYTAKSVKRHQNSAKEVVSFAVFVCTVSESKKKEMFAFRIVYRSSFGTILFHFYRAMLCIRGTSHGPVSVRLSVRYKSEFY